MCDQKFFTLLEDADTYNPDTLDLNKDPDAAEYWFNVFQKIITKFAKQAADSQRNIDVTAMQRAEDFRLSYMEQLERLKDDNNSK